MAVPLAEPKTGTRKHFTKLFVSEPQDNRLARIEKWAHLLLLAEPLMTICTLVFCAPASAVFLQLVW